MTQAQDTGPLDWRIAIVDGAGRPTPEFQRRWAIQRANNGKIGNVVLGSGPPPSTPTPADGDEYVDIASDPFTLYVGSDGSWHKVGTDLDDIGSVQGDILYRDVDKWEALPPGTAGQVLTTGGPSANPKWAAIGGGFTFSCSGPVPASTLMGAASWGKTITFVNSDPGNNGTCLVKPVANYTFPLTDATLVSVGSINITTGGVFSVVWGTSPLVWPADKIMLISTQAIADLALAGVNIRVVGTF